MDREKEKVALRGEDGWIALLIVTTVVCLWELIVWVREVPLYILPAPSRIVVTLFNNLKVYIVATWLTLGEAVLGLILGLVCGAGVAVLLSLWPRLERGVIILAILLKSTPMVAIAPLLTIWLGFGVLPKVIITAILTFFPVLVNMLSGLQSTDPALLDTLNSWRASKWEMFLTVRLPQSLPYLFAALKVSGPLALIGAVVAEWTGASGGLGRMMWLAYTNLNLPFLFAAVFVLAAAGIGIFSILVWLERQVVFWIN
jgi:ABC-type nitrate/sulfonate/bicarbonate transport system permease component